MVNYMLGLQTVILNLMMDQDGIESAYNTYVECDNNFFPDYFVNSGSGAMDIFFSDHVQIYHNRVLKHRNSIDFGQHGGNEKYYDIHDNTLVSTSITYLNENINIHHNKFVDTLATAESYYTIHVQSNTRNDKQNIKILVN